MNQIEATFLNVDLDYRMRFSARMALALLAAMMAVNEASAEEVTVSGCPHVRNYPVQALMPLNPRPLALTSLHCLKLPSSSFPISPPRPSPDQSSAFVFDSIQGLSIVGLGTEAVSQHFEGRLTASLRFTGSVPFTWSRSSRSVFGVRQDTAKPSGFALGPLSPSSFNTDGTVQKLAELNNEAGPLDEIYWIGHDGLAVVGFGTKGGLYRPIHSDPRPTIAFVDAGAGKILQSIAIADLAGIAAKSRIDGVASDPDGRHVLITLASSQWVLWVLGQSPRLVPIDVKPWMTPYALSPGGKAALVMKNLSATGMICEHIGHGPQCPPPTPRSGAVAELYELPSGKLLWTLDGIAETFSRSDVPAISPDGRFGLISMPAGTVALISMVNGNVIQEIPKIWTSECSMGFSEDGKTAWVSGGSRIAVYKLN